MKFKNIEAFGNLEEADVENLRKHVAPLVYMDEFDLYAKGFDNLVYGLEVLKARNKSYSKQKAQIVNDANLLLKHKANIDQVKTQIPLLEKIVDDSYYASASVMDFEKMRAQKLLGKDFDMSADSGYMQNLKSTAITGVLMFVIGLVCAVVFSGAVQAASTIIAVFGVLSLIFVLLCTKWLFVALAKLFPITKATLVWGDEKNEK